MAIKKPKASQPEAQPAKQEQPHKPTSARVYPIIMYHPTLAPDGKSILSAEAHAGLPAGWVESPGLFPKASADA